MSNSLVSHGGGVPQGFDVVNTGTLIAPADQFRKFLAVTNASDTPVYLALSSSGAEVGKGIYLAPAGGAFELNNVNMYYGEVWAIHGATGTKRLCVQSGR